MRLSDQVPRVVIVGAGLGGTATAVRLLQFAREPVQVVLIERHPGYRSAGVAYHRAGNHWQHVFNIQAGRMSMFREDVDDFVDWANSEADRAGWPPEWSGFTFTESGPAPRRIYADYLAGRLARAAREAADDVSLVEADGEVVDVATAAGGCHVVVDRFCLPGDDAEPGRVTLRADHVVIATGLEERDLPFAAEVVNHPAFVRRPYSEAGIARILGTGPDATVVIIGTLLTAYDVAALLLRRGHRGKIAMISRSGRMLRTYPPDHRHRVLDLPAPRLHRESYEGRQNLLMRVVAEWERACAIVAREHPDVPPAVVSERVSKSWEPHLPGVLARIPSADLRGLLDQYGTLLATLRVGAVAYTTEVVDAAIDGGGPVTLVTGKVGRIDGTEAGTLLVSVAGASSSQTLEADLVISNFGREPDYGRTGSALWAALLRKKIAVQHRRTGRGVEVDGSGALLGPSGLPSGPVSVIGGPREGDEIVRNGRVGAFAFNLAAIKNHSVGVAAAVLRRLESCYDDRAGNLAAILTEDPGAREAFAALVMLEVRRMTARRGRDREALVDRLEVGLKSVRDAASGSELPGTDRALRAAVNTAATRKLNDLSVTPRELRGLLLLDEPPETFTSD
ncbi:FAD/NAD(P)-binding protein [Amycolatopsis sp. MtRt-6]|uniref:FAD/NAD(P)-binding protein n=1 Tax=Amycolatopsis sp. MtRt-6 TaxID=2792782 RepID=UPI001A8D785E|nr:FAD/NAD(P)-binding protein [Amycolatopsis sp. MtRt-6]